jgi:hypothetical protein
MKTWLNQQKTMDIYGRYINPVEVKQKWYPSILKLELQNPIAYLNNVTVKGNDKTNR